MTLLPSPHRWPVRRGSIVLFAVRRSHAATSASEGSAPLCPGRGPLSQPRKKRRGRRRRPVRDSRPQSISSGIVRCGLLDGCCIVEPKFGALAPDTMEQHGELAGNRNGRFACAEARQILSLLRDLAGPCTCLDACLDEQSWMVAWGRVERSSNSANVRGE
jgi:hypothetical protein